MVESQPGLDSRATRTPRLSAEVARYPHAPCQPCRAILPRLSYESVLSREAVSVELEEAVDTTEE